MLLIFFSADSYGASIQVNEGEPVYDFCWYPYMSVSDPATCVFATTSRDHPIHLWDATTGEVELAACACFVWS
jgi:WD40 repeat protein